MKATQQTRIILLAAQVTGACCAFMVLSKLFGWLIFSQLLGWKRNAMPFDASFFQYHALVTLPVTFALTMLVLFTGWLRSVKRES